MSVTTAFAGTKAPAPIPSDILIFLDLDGVVADFNTHATTHHKRQPNGWIKYKELDAAWWTTIPPYDGAKGFYDQLGLRAPVKFLTATPPISGSGSYSGKAAWVMSFTGDNYNSLKNLIICSRADKCLLAGPRRILIDDKAENIAEWIAAGGIGIHHTGDFTDTLRRLDVELAKLAPAQKIPSPGPAP